MRTLHGIVATPAFMPVATQASVKGLSPEEVRALGAGMVLSNAYHLYLRPGVDRVRQLGWYSRVHGLGWTGVNRQWRLPSFQHGGFTPCGGRGNFTFAPISTAAGIT